MKQMESECDRCLRKISQQRNNLTRHQLLMLRGQAENGDTEGALRELDKLVHRNSQCGRSDYAEQAQKTM